MNPHARAARAVLAAVLVAVALPAAASPPGPGDSASPVPVPGRRAVFLFAPPAGYRQPEAPIVFGASERVRCLGCHGLSGFLVRDSVSGEVVHLTVDSVAYRRSAHGALACTQCHPDVREFPHVFAAAGRPRVGCDADCHAVDGKGRAVRHVEQMEEFRAGVHRKGLAGEAGLPSCAYCHGEGDPHGARRVQEAFSREHRLALCADCHDDRVRMERAKQPVNATASYREGFHYAALRLGEERAAICQDCHDTHGVRAARDTASATNAVHLAATCGRKDCHTGAGPGFAASGTDHVGLGERGAAAARAGRLLAWAGGAIVALMALGVLLDLQRPLRAPAGTGGAALVPRLSGAMRLQHGTLVVSFTLLVLTGLPVRFPDVEAMRSLYALFGGWESARIVHRAAGALMLLVGLVHLGVALRRLAAARFDVARAWPMLPAAEDVREAWETLRWQLRLRREPPAYGRHEFRARIHYAAVLWGVPVMTVTGLGLWFAAPLAERLPGPALALLAVAHGEEAVVAVAIVLLWHFYNVHFAPGRGLRAWTLFDGRVTETHRAAVHPREGGPAGP